MAGLNRFMRRLLAVYTVLIALLICWQCVDMYTDAYRPEMLSDYGTPLEPAYTPEKVSARLNGVLVLASAWPVVWLGALILGKFVKTDEPGNALMPEYTLKQMKKRVHELPEGARNEERRKRRVRAIAGGAVLVCAGGSLAYLLDGSHFASWDLEPVMGDMMRHVAPWVAAGFIAMAVASEMEGRSVVREINLLADVPREARGKGEAGARGSRFPAKGIQICLLAVAIACIALGVMNGDPRNVLSKAIRICTECIGLG